MTMIAWVFWAEFWAALWRPMRTATIVDMARWRREHPHAGRRSA
jgi:hypothetical protein